MLTGRMVWARGGRAGTRTTRATRASSVVARLVLVAWMALVARLGLVALMALMVAMVRLVRLVRLVQVVRLVVVLVVVALVVRLVGLIVRAVLLLVAAVVVGRSLAASEEGTGAYQTVVEMPERWWTGMHQVVRAMAAGRGGARVASTDIASSMPLHRVSLFATTGPPSWPQCWHRPQKGALRLLPQGDRVVLVQLQRDRVVQGVG